MKIIAINGSPRKDWNTGILLNEALKGAQSEGAETEFIHLFTLNYKGCQSCFSCKMVGGKSYGVCARKDGITPVLEKIRDSCDGLVLGSPVYFGALTGGTRSFLERLLFPYVVYDNDLTTLFPRKINTGCIYTMNMTQEALEGGRMGFDKQIKAVGISLKRAFGASESLSATDTYQFEDYSKVVAPRFDAAHKAARRREVFPLDCRKAFEMGAKFARTRP